MSRPFWTHDDIKLHIDQHNTARASERTVQKTIGDIAASAVSFVWMPPHEAVMLKRLYFHSPSALDADPTDYWTLYLSQRDEDGRYLDLFRFSTASRGLSAHIITRHPTLGDDEVSLNPRYPVYFRAVTTGSPAAIDDLSIELVWVVR